MLIITYQVITGNYNPFSQEMIPSWIITYQVITGNYNYFIVKNLWNVIITYQVITGNYNSQTLYQVASATASPQYMGATTFSKKIAVFVYMLYC